MKLLYITTAAHGRRGVASFSSDFQCLPLIPVFFNFAHIRKYEITNNNVSNMRSILIADQTGNYLPAAWEAQPVNVRCQGDSQGCA